MEIEFNNLQGTDLVIDCIYKGGTAGNVGDDPLSKIFPQLGNMSGFRKKARNDNSGKLAYVVLYTSMEELEWPDHLDVETGVFRYYGDNRKPGNPLLKTKQGGNKLLEEVFSTLHLGKNLDDIPPFFVFKKGEKGRDVQFLGLAAPGNPSISPDRDLVAFWRTIGDERFQNYEAYFTILNTGEEPISHLWLEALLNDHENSIKLAPKSWQTFINKGREGISALKAPKIFEIPSKYEQLQSDEEGTNCLEIIRNHYKDHPSYFEACATSIVQQMDNNFIDFSLTRPWRDGGRDAIGFYSISNGGIVNPALKIDCALEAKCYSKDNSVGVKQMSRLISRIRYRQFGILITTSFIDKQAYQEVVEDGHPILIITASDIAGILRKNSINTENIYQWLDNIDRNNPYFD